MKRLLNILLATLALGIFPGRTEAADWPAEFNAANKLYAEGKFADAASAYQRILQSGPAQPGALFQLRQRRIQVRPSGRAIAAYRRATQLAPRDAEARANLEFVRNQVSGPALRESRWSRSATWLGTLTLNEWTALAATAFWLTFALLASMQIRPALKPALRTLTLAMVAATLLAGAGLGVDAAIHFPTKSPW